MAQKLTAAQAETEVGHEAGRSVPRYPWVEWTDGSWWKIQKDEDYDIDTGNMRRALLMRAQRHSMTIEAHKRGDSLIFKFNDNG